MDEIIRIREELTHTEGSARIPLLIELGFVSHTQNPSEMFRLLKEAEQLAEKHSTPGWNHRIYQNYSAYYGMKGDYDKSLENALKALSIILERDKSELLPGLYNNLGIIYTRLGDLESSNAIINKAMIAAKNSGNIKQKAISCHNMGLNYEAAKNFEMAYCKYSESTQLVNDLENPDFEAVALNNSANMAIKTGRIEEALRNAEKAFQISKDRNNKLAEAGALGMLARVYAVQEKDEKAERFFLESLELNRELRNCELELSTLRDLSLLKERQSLFQEALEYQRKYSTVKDQLMNDSRNRHIAQLKAEMETLEKSNELEIYRLRNKELQMANEIAEASTKAKSDFLAMISHEIRTPMSVIQGMLELLLDSNLTPLQENYLEKTHIASKSLLGVINDILDFSRIDAGKLTFESIPFCLKEIVRQAVELFALEAETKGIFLEMNFDNSIPGLLIGDPLRISQIMRNLISNAVKFTDNGTVSVSSKLLIKKENSCGIELTVRDTGIGMDSRKLNQLFEPFHQMDVSTTRKFGGTGLGLSICHRLITAMDGAITVESNPGEGSLFKCTFTMSTPDKETAEKYRSPEQMKADIRGVSVLIVEDQEVIIEIAGLFMTEAGIKFKTALNGEDALSAIKENEFDVVLMDIQMPVMDGLTASRKIRELGVSIPIVATTGHAMTGQYELYLESGLNDCLVKPYSREGLLSMIAKWVFQAPANCKTDE